VDGGWPAIPISIGFYGPAALYILYSTEREDCKSGERIELVSFGESMLKHGRARLLACSLRLY